MSKITHYSNPQSRGMRTQILLDTFNIAHEFENIDFKSGENKTDSVPCHKLVGIYPDTLPRYDQFLANVRPKLPKLYGGTRES